VPADHRNEERGTPVAAGARTRIAVGASANLVGQLSTLAGGVITSIFVAQRFGPDGTGTYALIGNVFGSLMLLTALGFATGITFVVSRGRWTARAAFRQSAWVAVAMGLIGMALGLGFYALTDDSILDGISLVEALAVMGALPLGLNWLFCGAIALGREQYEQFGSFQISRAALTTAVVIGLGIPLGLPGAIVGFAIAQVLSSGVAAASLLRSTRAEERGNTTQPRGAGPSSPLRAALKFGRRAWSAEVLQLLNYRLDLFILAALATRADVGRYSLAVSLTMVAWLVPTAIGQVLLPRTASLDSASEVGEVDRAQADGAIARVIRHTVILQVPTGLALGVLLLVAIPLAYGPAFDQSIVLGFLLLPGVLALSIAKVVSAVVTGRGFPHYAVYNVLITLPVTLGLYFTLIPPFEASGAAVASSVSYTLTTVVTLYFYRRATGASVRAAVIPTVAEVREYPRAASQLLSASHTLLSALRHRAT
jgi:O-antigen/teichoic acid export membrane protein